MKDNKSPRGKFMFTYDGPHAHNVLSVLAINEEEAMKRAEKLRPNCNIKRLRTEILY